MSDQATNALIAVLLGSVAAIVLLVPTAAVQYRLDGKLGPGDLAVLLGAAVYGLSLWTYTLLPMPARGTFRCKLPQTDLFGTISTMGLPEHGLRAFLREPAVLQVLLNVLLFVPLGYFLRVILKRGVLVATLGGFAVSLAIELTQRSGDWGLYGCAYRKFDVDDLLVNTLGALVGSLLSWPVVRRRKEGPPPLPATITYGRRLVGMVCDALVVLMVGGFVAALWRGLMLFVLDTGPHLAIQWVLQWTVPFGLEAACVLLLGRTIGEAVVSVRAEARSRALVLPSRLLKLAFGLGPVYLLVVLPVPYRGPLVAAYVAMTLLLPLATPDRGGLSHLVAGMRLQVVAPPGRVRSAASTPAAGSA